MPAVTLRRVEWAGLTNLKSFGNLLWRADRIASFELHTQVADIVGSQGHERRPTLPAYPLGILGLTNPHSETTDVTDRVSFTLNLHDLEFTDYKFRATHYTNSKEKVVGVPDRHLAVPLVVIAMVFHGKI